MSKGNRGILIAYNKGCRVRKDGSIIGVRGNTIKGVLCKGYVTLSLKIDKKKYGVKAHRLQAYQKFGDKIFDKNIVVRHLNGNPLDNSWDNISIGTRLDNILDIPKEKRKIMAGKGNRKYNYRAIKDDHKKGLNYNQLMEKYKVSSKGTLSHIINSDMPDEYQEV